MVIKADSPEIADVLPWEPQEIKCPTCRGSGSDMEATPCPRCGGRGCAWCNDGAVPVEVPCGRCGGSGKVETRWLRGSYPWEEEDIDRPDSDQPPTQH